MQLPYFRFQQRLKADLAFRLQLRLLQVELKQKVKNLIP